MGLGGKVQLLAFLIKSIYHLTAKGNKLHSYAGIGNYFLMGGNMKLLQKCVLKAARANRAALFFC